MLQWGRPAMGRNGRRRWINRITRNIASMGPTRYGSEWYVAVWTGRQIHAGFNGADPLWVGMGPPPVSGGGNGGGFNGADPLWVGMERAPKTPSRSGFSDWFASAL